MTDDVQYTLRVEIIPIEDLQVSSPAGFKIVILKGKFVDGLLQLVPEGLEVLGAMVEDLGDAHPKSVEEVFESPKSESYIWDIPAPC
ncbi:hypothetical protein C5167_024123 [Papaver somniferum]|uniref:RecQ-mediated genome instability protein 1 n=1 Tax=Papaver somniferum TaxID=3469 RepID=A0A4Y7JRI4_PAPSO|nr:recQ-mediated genome instability protein 1-like [Papaver somniferum]RZC62359.1 hypothetical protein C5167_024123 [Papaver somniferum]